MYLGWKVGERKRFWVRDGVKKKTTARMRVADLQVGVDDAVAVQIVGVGLAVPSRVVPDRIVLAKTKTTKKHDTGCKLEEAA